VYREGGVKNKNTEGEYEFIDYEIKQSSIKESR
jgi:hypothetical protein